MAGAKGCHTCGTAWEGAPGTQPGRNETCARCGADLHCCLNCRLYDPSAHNQCRSRTTEPVKEKDKRNFCDEFEMTGGKSGGSGPPQDDMQKKWNDLFK
jgi:hypothetical protein